MPILLAEVKVNGLTVRLEQHTDGDDTPFIRLSGVDCDFEGEMPGEYYVVPRAQEASR